METPKGMISVPLGKGCILLLTEQEYVNALKRGKIHRRREAEDRREAKAVSERGRLEVNRPTKK